MRPSIPLRIALSVCVASAALVAGGVASALGAATTVTLGAPTGAMVGGGGLIPFPDPVARAERSTSLTDGGVPWAFTVPRAGSVVEYSVLGAGQFGAVPAPAMRLIRVAPALGGGGTIQSLGVNRTLPTTFSSQLFTFSENLPVAAGDILGVAWQDFAMGSTTVPGSDGTSMSLGGPYASFAPGAVLAGATGGALTIQAQYKVALVPLSTGPPVVSPATPTVGVAVTGTDGTWDAAPDSVAHQWLRCDAAGAACGLVAGATASSYTPTTSDIGYSLRLRVTATNVGGTGAPAESAATGVVTNGIFPPPPTSAPAVTTSLFFAPNDPPQPKVTLCHATASDTNPYVAITVAPESVFTKGHDQHQNREDIIPPFDYVKSGKTLPYAGLNWDAKGRAIYAAGCATPQSTPQQQILSPPAKSKVTICHATASASNPYVVITVAPESIFKQGHDQHQNREDIIPPFSYEGGSYPGLNWDSEGRAILENGCDKPTPVVDPLEDPATNVTLCHRVGGPQYVRITVAPQGALNGHAKNHSLDIIPPFTYRQGKREVTFPGQNWDAEGRAAWSNGCVSPPSPQPIRPEVTCIAPQADGTYIAYFAYASENTQARNIPIGAANAVATDALSTGAAITGQPTVFAPGRVDAQLAVGGIVQVGTASWTITYDGVTTTATATSASPRCPMAAEETPEVGVYAQCVTPAANGTYSATFGYQNDGVNPVTVPIGAANSVALSGPSPGAADRGQPTSFAPGRITSAFTVTGIARSTGITWTLDLASGARQAHASWASPRCAGSPEEALPIGLRVTCVQPNGDGTYDAVFGYANPNGVSVEVPAGPGNAVSVNPSGPGPESRGQPIQFQPGSNDDAFSVMAVPVGQEVTWTVAHNGTATVTAGSGLSPRCAPEPPTPQPPVEPVAPRPPDPTPITPELLPIGVYVECVQANARTYDATFGYVNPSPVAFSVAIGSGNSVTGGPDRGQPTTFSPGNVGSAFTVRGIARRSSVTWRVVAPDGREATATSSAAGPNCQVDVPPDDPRILVDVDPPTDPTPPRSGPPTIVLENPGPTPDERPAIIVPRIPGVVVTPATPNVVCRTGTARILCRSTRPLLPGRSMGLRVSGRRCESAPQVLGAVAVVRRPGPGSLAGSSSAPTRLGGCTAPVAG